ncbi:ParB/RepB/Spo0J family partition protein [Moraxella equi]|nr:ParB/RepB/Spo0J family partition protein [Moraxella equi]OPH39686.1 chromosome partitioning protein ParB [Moraxella equi]
MTKKRGLATKRGLEALMGNIKRERDLTAEAIMPTAESAPTPKSASPQKTGTKANADKSTAQVASKFAKTIQPQPTQDGEQVTLIQIDPARLQSGKYQPRRDVKEEALQELAESVRQHGVMQPIVIRPLLDGESKADGITHEIIAGERRWRAAKLAGLTTIPAIERVLSDEVAIALALIENIQREDLTVLEQAAALERFHTEFGMSHAMIADVVGKARTTVSNLLRLNALHDEVKAFMMDNLLDMGHARTLLSLSKDQQPIIAKKIIHADMTVREAEKLVKSILHPEPKAVLVNSREVIALNQKLSDALGATVKLKQGKDGKGSVEIFFHSHDELSGLMAQLGVAKS